MNGMSPEANRLVNAGREAFSPTDADRARLMTALTGTATLSLVAAIGARTPRPFNGIFGAGHAARLLAIAVPVAAAGAIWLHAGGHSPKTVQAGLVVHPAPVAVTPKAAEVPLPVVDKATESPSEPSSLVSAERSGPSVGESSKRGNEIRKEVALLSKAQAALSRGRPQEALEALAEHSQRFPRGVLSEERAATLVRTLCALGRTREAAAELKRIETLNPTSAYLAPARESCGF